jgi:hypothetical protein
VEDAAAALPATANVATSLSPAIAHRPDAHTKPVNSRLGSGGRTAAIVGVAMACLVGCTAGTTPKGHAVLPHRVRVATPQRSRAAPSPVAQCLARKVPGSTVVPFRGTTSPRKYCGVVWSDDILRNCGRRAYGAAVVAFVRRHRCGRVRRVLATVYVGGFSVNVSSVVTSFTGTAHNPYGAANKFAQLAGSRRAGGIADLLRAGHRIPGPHGRPPANAHYEVIPFDVPYNTQVDILDSWYRKGPAYRGGANSLEVIENDLSFGRLTSLPVSWPRQ